MVGNTFGAAETNKPTILDKGEIKNVWIYKRKCMCGADQPEVPGEPLAMLICHCIDCKAWWASPVNGATAFERDELSVIKGQEFIKNYNSSQGHDRCWSSKCGGHIFPDHPAFDLIVFYASVLDGIELSRARTWIMYNQFYRLKTVCQNFKIYPKNWVARMNWWTNNPLRGQRRV